MFLVPAAVAMSNDAMPIINSKRNDMEGSRKVEKRANPARTLWLETYQLWDEVLHQVGKAYYKAKPPKSRPKSGTRPGSEQRSSDRSREAREAREARETYEARNMQLVRQRSCSSDGWGGR